MLPTTRYAKSGNVHVAYQVFGDGDIDLVLFPSKIRDLVFLRAAKTPCALANHRRPYEFFERDIPIRMGHCRRLERPQ